MTCVTIGFVTNLVECRVGRGGIADWGRGGAGGMVAGGMVAGGMVAGGWGWWWLGWWRWMVAGSEARPKGAES